MKLENKKFFIAKTLGVGKSRITLNITRLNEIKEAITKQDVRDLLNDKAIKIKEIKGKLTKRKRKTRRRAGSIKKKVNTGKKDYIRLTRKLRNHLATLKRNGRISQEVIIKVRKQIRAKEFRSIAHMKERLKEMEAKN